MSRVKINILWTTGIDKMLWSLCISNLQAMDLDDKCFMFALTIFIIYSVNSAL